MAFLSLVSPKKALAGAEHDGEDLHPQHIDKVVLHQETNKLKAGWDLDFAPSE